ncbi:zinc knuckle CX2CX4HX4C containing protein [Tanacetum coccineum]
MKKIIHSRRGARKVVWEKWWGGIGRDAYEIDKFTKDLELGKYAVWSELTSDKREEVLDNITTKWNAIVADLESKPNDTPIADDNMSSEVSPNDPIVQSVYIHEKPSSYVGAAGGSKPEPSKAKANFHPLFSDNLCKGANVSIPKRLLKRIMMNSKGFFFFQFKTSKGLEDVIENGPWMIRKSPIILKKWTMNTRLCKDELTRIPVWVKIHDVPIQVFSEDGLSIIASQIGKPIMLDSYISSMCIESWGRSSFARCLIEINVDDVLKESLTIGVPLIEGSRFTIESVLIPTNVVTPIVPTSSVEKTNDEFQTVGKKKKKGKSKSTNVGQIGGHSVKQNVKYDPKATSSTPKKGATNVGKASQSSSMLKKKPTTTITSTKEGNITMSNSYAALGDESDEDVENVYDESANLFPTKTGENSSTFTAAVG